MQGPEGLGYGTTILAGRHSSLMWAPWLWAALTAIEVFKEGQIQAQAPIAAHAGDWCSCRRGCCRRGPCRCT